MASAERRERMGVRAWTFDYWNSSTGWYGAWRCGRWPRRVGARLRQTKAVGCRSLPGWERVVALSPPPPRASRMPDVILPLSYGALADGECLIQLVKVGRPYVDAASSRQHPRMGGRRRNSNDTNTGHAAAKGVHVVSPCA